MGIAGTMPAMHAPLRALVARFLGSWAATAAAGFALGIVAAAVEGSPLDPQRLRRLLAGPTLALAATWTLSAWRREAGDVALAALGHRPAYLVWGIAALAACLAPLATGGDPRGAAVAALTPSEARFHLQDGPVELRWRENAARLPGRAPWPALPPPSPAAPPERPRLSAAPLLAALAALIAGLGPRLGPLSAVALAGGLSVLAALWGLGGSP